MSVSVTNMTLGTQNADLRDGTRHSDTKAWRIRQLNVDVPNG
ncbi:MAG: hypothetical protein U0T81_09965 [Saprospiraceae bacterium]